MTARLPILLLALAAAAGIPFTAAAQSTPAATASAAGVRPAATQAAASSATPPAPYPAIAAVSPGARLAATCTGCHGTNGATTGIALPPLAGQAEQFLLSALRDFKSGARPSTIMGQISKGYTDQQLAQLAAFFAAQKGAKP